MKFPYGMTDFGEIVTGGYFYCDRTDRVPFLEQAKSQLFIRPRRFGKSLLLSMLEHYYDVARKDEFEEIFGGLQIGRQPTELRNSYFVLRWDFSCVDASGTADEIRTSLYNHINFRIDQFVAGYRNAGFDIRGVRVDRKNALSSVESLLTAVSTLGHPVYLLIDEYDNFINSTMMQAGRSREQYEDLIHVHGILKSLFKTLKFLTSSTGFDRVFITGVLPVELSDISSGYNIAEDVYRLRKFNSLCGFQGKEVEQVLRALGEVNDFSTVMVEKALLMVKACCGEYRFCREGAESIYSPASCLNFFRQVQEQHGLPDKTPDAGMAVDQTDLQYVNFIAAMRDVFESVMQQDREFSVNTLVDRFGPGNMLDATAHTRDFLLSFLYYSGVLTLAGEDDLGRLLLRAPNQARQARLSLYTQ